VQLLSPASGQQRCDTNDERENQAQPKNMSREAEACKYHEQYQRNDE
jgi:hypothetical protein